MIEKFPYLNKQSKYVIYTVLAVFGFGGAALFGGAGIYSYAIAFLSMGIAGTVLFITEFMDLTNLNKKDEEKKE